MLYWLPRLCVLGLLAMVLGLGLIPRTAEGVAYTLLVVVAGLGLLSATLHVFPPKKH